MLVTQTGAINFRSSAQATKAYVDMVNEQGGVNGRRIEVLDAEWLCVVSHAHRPTLRPRNIRPRKMRRRRRGAKTMKIFLDTAATVHGLREGARSIASPRKPSPSGA